MKRQLLFQATQIAKSKLGNHPQGSHIHFSFIVQKNNLIGYGINQDGDPPVHWGYKKNKNDSTYVPKIHSEINAYIKNKARIAKNIPFEIINIKLNKKGEFKLSKPCMCCGELLTELGCKRFYYSDTGGFLTTYGKGHV